MKRVLTTLALGFGLTVGAVFAANAAPSVVITPGAHTVVATSSVATPSVPRATGSNSHGHGHGGSSGGGSGSSNRRSSSVSTLSSSAGTWVKDAHGWWLNYGAGNYSRILNGIISMQTVICILHGYISITTGTTYMTTDI